MHGLPRYESDGEKWLTIRVDQWCREEEGDDIADEPQADLDKPATVLQVLIPLVALELDAKHSQGQKAKEQLHPPSALSLLKAAWQALLTGLRYVGGRR